jgi:hypothetical protein
MKNPYKILGIGCDADKNEIMKAQIIAMKEKKYSLREIAVSSKQLLDPAKRLAAQTLFCHSKIILKRPLKISVDIQFENIELDEKDENMFDSLK